MKNVLAKPIIEVRSMPTLLEQRNNLVTELEGLVNKAKEETRSMNEDELTNFNRIKSEIEGIDKTLKAEMDSRSLVSDKEIVVAKSTEEVRMIQEQEEKFLRFVRGEERALDVAGNGSIIPQIIANRIITKVRELSPIYARATIFNVGGDLIFPKFDVNSITTAYVGDLQELTANNGNFTTVKLQNFIAGSLVIISRSLMNRTDFNLVDFIVNQMAQSIANFLENQLLNGVGTTAMTGIFVDTGATSVTTAGATIALDDLISTQMSVQEVYQPQCAWIMNKSIFTSLRKLKDTTGMPILLQNGGNVREGYGWELLGKPVFVSDNAPAGTATGNKVMAYGDFSGLYVKLAQNVEMQILSEKYATQHGIGVVAYVEADSRIVEDGKIAVLKML